MSSIVGSQLNSVSGLDTTPSNEAHTVEVPIELYGVFPTSTEGLIALSATTKSNQVRIHNILSALYMGDGKF